MLAKFCRRWWPHPSPFPSRSTLLQSHPSSATTSSSFCPSSPSTSHYIPTHALPILLLSSPILSASLPCPVTSRFRSFSSLHPSPITRNPASPLSSVDKRNVQGTETLLPENEELAQGVVEGSRSALSKAITLMESQRPDHQVQSNLLLSRVVALAHQTLESTANTTATSRGRKPSLGLGGVRTFRLGISGPPGVGKSTFIEAMGNFLTGQGHRVAVLAVDPSSTRSGGSILGDKSRMTELARNENAFVRPSATGGHLGGVTQHTNDLITLCECAGYDVIIVETVGVGQSEVSVEGMVDMVALLVPPGGGDELQGIKKGIMEVADLVIVNKADGDLASTASTTKAEYASALHLQARRYQKWAPTATTCSALTTKGISDVWDLIQHFRDAVEGTGELTDRRRQQRKDTLWTLVQHSLMLRLRNDPKTRQLVRGAEAQVLSGDVTPRAAAEAIVRALLHQNQQ